MSSINIFFGAGASKDSKAPLVCELITKARNFAKNNIISSNEIKTIEILQKEALNQRLDPCNIEDILQIAVDGNISNKNKIELLNSIEHIIADTIENCIYFPVFNNELKPSCPSYSKLADLIRDIRSSAKSIDFSLMTTNYDVCLDVAVIACGLTPYYCLNPDRGPHSNEISLLKLHGALNWCGCFGSGHISINAKYHVDEFFKNYIRKGNLIPDNEDGLLLHFRRTFSNLLCEKCNTPLKVPLILPPGWEKTSYRSDMGIIWRRAEVYLKESSLLVVIGYSWNPADSHINRLLALALGNKKSRIIVFDPNKAALNLARKILGVEDYSNRVCLFNKDFSHSLPIIENEINKIIGK
jgi:hypothetical protein